jgi:hypothetical protein
VRAAPAEDRCSLRSRAALEPLAGTASRIRRWLLIEHAGPWGRDGLLDARLPEGLGRGLRELERRTDARVLLIRRIVGMSPRGVTCVAVDTAEAWRGRIQIDRIEDALELDPRDRTGFETAPGPLIVVCTHGRRDVCCAERGRPLAGALAAAFPDLAWESTHVGGDRFAGNLVAFPHGLYFGRVEPGEGTEIVRAYGEGAIARLDRYRGRSSHPFHVQAAEVALRQRLSLERVEAVRRPRSRRDGDLAEVVFDTPSGAHLVRLERSFGEPMRLTCRSAREEPPPLWRATDIRPTEPDEAGSR